MREIIQYSRMDTSTTRPITFATQFDGKVRHREMSMKQLEGYYKNYKWPEVDEIRFKK